MCVIVLLYQCYLHPLSFIIPVHSLFVCILLFMYLFVYHKGYAVAQLVETLATSRKVARSITDDVIGIFYL
jgi:hypothetical protein